MVAGRTPGLSLMLPSFPQIPPILGHRQPYRQGGRGAVDVTDPPALCSHLSIKGALHLVAFSWLLHFICILETCRHRRINAGRG